MSRLTPKTQEGSEMEFDCDTCSMRGTKACEACGFDDLDCEDCGSHGTDDCPPCVDAHLLAKVTP